MIRRWIRGDASGMWHLQLPESVYTRCGWYDPRVASSVETERVPPGDVCPTCYRSTKTQAEVDALAAGVLARITDPLRHDDRRLLDELALLIGATR